MKVKECMQGWSIQPETPFFLEGLEVEGIYIYRTVLDGNNFFSALACYGNGAFSRIGRTEIGSAFILDESRMPLMPFAGIVGDS